MSEIIVPAAYFTAGISMYAFVRHIQVGLHKPIDFKHLVFALMSLCEAIYAPINIKVIHATSAMESALAFKHSFPIVVFFLIGMLLFISNYTQKPCRPLIIGLSFAYLLLILVNILQPYGLQFTELSGIKKTVLSSGEWYTIVDGVRSPWYTCAVAVFVLQNLYMLYAVSALIYRKPNRHNSAMLLALLLFIGCYLEAILVRSGIINFLPLGNFGGLGLIVVMSIILNQEHSDERKASAQAIEVERKRLETILKTANDGIYILNEQGALIEANDAFLRMLGLEHSQLSKLRHGDWEAHFSKAQFALQMQSVLEHPHPLFFETYYRRLDGSTLEVEVSSNIVNLEGKTYLFCASRDITARKRSEAELRISEERHRLLTENTRDIIWTMNQDAQLLYVSPSVEAVRGFSIQEAMAQTLAQIHTQDSARIIQAYFNRLHAALNRGETVENFRGELEYNCKDGSTLWTEVMAYPLLCSDGSFAQLIGVTRDISERKQYEWELEQARLTAESATRAKSQFLANMSHEIRTPINAISGFTTLLLESELSVWQRESLNRVQNASRTLLTLINDILDYSKIEAGYLHFEQSTFLLTDIVSNTLDLFTLKLQEKKLKLHTQIAPDLPLYLIGDGLRLGQVLNNLLNNAIKFTAQGEIHLRIEPVALPTSNPSHSKLRFSIRDQGIGIAEHDLAQLFTPFTQSDASITRRFGGTGLGLSIAKNLVEMMHGEISVQSTENVGSVFSFTVMFGLPEQQPQAISIDRNAERLSSSFADIVQQSHAIWHAHVLVVEDDNANQLITQGFLEKLKLQVTLASNGYEALQWVRKQSFDLILMDLMMPGMDGFATTQQIRTLPLGKDVPIVAATASVMQETVDTCIASGMNDHLSKPMNLALLAQCLCQWIAPRDPTDDTTAPIATTLADNSVLPPLLSKLEQQLAHNLFSAKTATAEIEQHLQATALAAQFEPISHAVRQLRYSDALHALRAFTQDLD